ncbi:hypothetical protein F4677DRAFT_110382 [Hypoxylon crocopeplum]|nr:hypothetical protein F4677DRAFT_110382 [Hypoxylon crocopeplum]
MVRLSILSILAVCAAAALAAPAAFVDFADSNPDNPSVILIKTGDGSFFINQTATFLMVSRANQDDATRADTARAGIVDVQSEQAMLGLILNQLAGRGKLDRSFKIITAADRKIVEFFKTVQNCPSLGAARDCGLAIACLRNTMVNELSLVLNTFNTLVNHAADTRIRLPHTDIQSDKTCGSKLNFCFQKG